MSGDLTAIDQRQVVFYDDELTAVKGDDGRVYVSVKHMCDAIGLNARGQTQRIERHHVLSRGKGVCKIHTPGGAQETVVLRVDLIPLWLAGLRASMVKEDIRPKIERFQEEAAAVLWEAFQEGRLTVDTAFSDLLQAASPELVDAYKMAQAMVKLAQNQIVMEARLNNNTAVLGDHEQRLERVEALLAPADHAITEAQATQLSQAVKAVALELSKQTRRNQYGGVYGELYRRFEINSYKLLPATKFEEAMDWLQEWYSSLVGDAPF